MLKLLYRVALYLLPFGMSTMEMELNEVAGKAEEAARLLAPTIAAAAIGLFIPLVRTSDTSPKGIKKRVDGWATGLSFLALGVGVVAWHTLVSANLKTTAGHWMQLFQILSLSPANSIAILVYLLSVVLSEVKLFVEK